MQNEKYYYIRDRVKTSENGLGRPVITVCLIKIGDERARGIAICSDKDQPCKRIGRAIARERANYALSVGKDASVIGRWSLPNIQLTARTFRLIGDQDFKAYFNPVLTEFESSLLNEGDVNADSKNDLPKMQSQI